MKSMDINLALFGKTGSGKTVYLSMLVHSIQQHYGRRFYVDFSDEEAEKYLEDRIKEIVELEQWPSATQPHQDGKVVFDIVSHDNESYVRYRTVDLPGEIVRDLFIPGTTRPIWKKSIRRSLPPYKKYVNKICDLIERSNSFIFLIDPRGDIEDKDRLCEDAGQDSMCECIIEEIIEIKNINSPEKMPPVLFLFTKWDAYREQFPDFERYARGVLYATFLKHGNMLENSKIMNCSGVGKTRVVEIDGGDGSEKKLRPKRPIQPRGVAESLFWVIKNCN